MSSDSREGEHEIELKPWRPVPQTPRHPYSGLPRPARMKALCGLLYEHGSELGIVLQKAQDCVLKHTNLSLFEFQVVPDADGFDALVEQGTHHVLI
jgi:hypothetical protein